MKYLCVTGVFSNVYLKRTVYLFTLWDRVYIIFCKYSQYGTSPLLWASRRGHVEIVQELLSNGAHVDSTGMVRYTYFNC